MKNKRPSISESLKKFKIVHGREATTEEREKICQHAGVRERPPIVVSSNSELEVCDLPAAGKIKRYIFTSAQNNTPVDEGCLDNLLALAEAYHAEFYLGSLTYNKATYGERSVKRGTKKASDTEPLWWDLRLKENYFKDGQSMKLGKGLQFRGPMQIEPTAVNPLSGLNNVGGRQSIIIPHTKINMASVRSLEGNGAKLMYSTGTVTQPNYIQKKSGQKAESYHNLGGLLVEVDSYGVWKVRQLEHDAKTNTIQDLNILVKDGKIVDIDARVEGITLGDLHCPYLDRTVFTLTMDMLNVLKPKWVFIHDAFDGSSVNHHEENDAYSRVVTEQRGLTSIRDEAKLTAEVLTKLHRPGTQQVIVKSNHDRWLDRYFSKMNLSNIAPSNLPMYWEVNAARARASEQDPSDPEKRLNVLEFVLREYGGLKTPAHFLRLNQSHTECAGVEHGLHGDFGAAEGRPVNLAHTHSAAIKGDVYHAGTSTKFRIGYNNGPSAWTHSHIVTYPNGKRTIITMYTDDNGRSAWRAEEE